MILSLVAVALLALAAAILLGLELRRVTGLYESMYRFVIGERDAVKEENKTLKTALFPQLARNQQSKSVDPSRAPSGVREGFMNLEGLGPRRVPWRIRFKQLVQQNNTRQVGRDRMAAAISPQPAAKEPNREP